MSDSSKTVPRALSVAVVVMGVMLVFGTIALVVAIVLRGHLRPAAAPGGAGVPVAAPGDAAPMAAFDPLHLGEPAGSRIVSVSQVDGLVALTVSGGGPDRVLLVDWRHRQVVARLVVE